MAGDLVRLVEPDDPDWFARELAPLRTDGVHRPHYVDHTRPTTAAAAYPGGIVPEDAA